jgi:hypothetical protein
MFKVSKVVCFTYFKNNKNNHDNMQVKWQDNNNNKLFAFLLLSFYPTNNNNNNNNNKTQFRTKPIYSLSTESQIHKLINLIPNV